MCMITYVPAGIEIPWEGIENGAKTNRDGHGWAIASAMGLEVGKSMDFTEAALDLDAARERHGLNSVVLFHSRWGTHGVMGEYNIHPFYVDEAQTTVMAHNGILAGEYHPKGKDPRSDTRIFVERMAKYNLNPETGVPSRRIGKRLGDFIGAGNKLLFLSIAGGEPKVRIINAWMGEWEGGVWYSNTGYKASRFWSSTRSVGSQSAAGESCGTRGWDGWEEDDWDPMWGLNYTAWKRANGLEGVPRETILDGKVVEVGARGDSSDCPFCGAVDAIDPLVNLCKICWSCLDCSETAADCMCYSIPHQEKAAELFALPALPNGWQPEATDAG